MPSSKETLSRRLKELMAKRPDLDSQSKISRRTGLAQSTVGRLIHQVNAADIDVVDLLADAFGVTASELLSGEVKNIYLASLLRQLNVQESNELILFIEFLLKKRNMTATGVDFESETVLSRRSAASVSRASALDIDHETGSSNERIRKRS